MNSRLPLLSVLVPLYKVEPYVERCVRSLLDQTLNLTARVEYIFVDDGSPDASADAVRRAAAAFPGRDVRILVHERNRGLAAARSTALDAARGEWVVHVDSDDWLSPDALEALLAEGRLTKADVVYGGYALHDGGRTLRRVAAPEPDRQAILRSLLRQDFRVDNRTWGILFRRSLYEGIRPVEGLNFAEDYAVVPRLLRRAVGVASVDRTLYYYRTANGSSYMNNLTGRSADAYVEANRRVTAAFAGDAAWHEALVEGKLNVAKWILKRGFDPEPWLSRLFAPEWLPRDVLGRLYLRAIRSHCLPLAQAVGWIVNRR